ncbi:hypothetical protein H8K90_11905 [Winogradskyella echinorum]|uniref:Lipoprotein n=1 Tax=Winogradskyella echinorum TaxID=538189 RepID=A0ABR6Y2W9_9FLAO|nr:hypothetical protein [Winogradskyella echinorum]MBC3847089.1 hypothetical protein [Winogradskyella echinorum]MBC5751437.1 hypothetical protein [Winogradskyella echinorum]
MKTWKSIILIAIAILLNSCIVKSLQPFYTKDSLSFDKNLLGNWIDNKKGEWTVESIKEKFEQDKREGVTLSEEDKVAYETYKSGYYIKYLKKEKEASFIAMPFKINNQYFLDFIPIEIGDEEINSLAAEHLLKTHSVAKLDINKTVSLSWLDESKVKDIFNANKMRLKHENIGPEEALLLTATSEELYAFLKKYMKANIENKWKKSDQLTLTKTNAKP